MQAKRLVALSGPSCVGKGPLVAALKRFHPDLSYSEISVIKSRESRPSGPRPNETAMWKDEAFFRSAEEIRKLAGNPQFLVGECLGLPQAVDLAKVKDSESDLLFMEIYFTLAQRLVSNTFFEKVQITTLFLSPVSRTEIEDLKMGKVDVAGYVRQLMIDKQLARARYYGKPSTITQDVDERATDAYKELAYACHCDRVIVNHDGEGCPNWCRLPTGPFTERPQGDAGRALTALFYILSGAEPPCQCESWTGLVL